MSNCSLFEEEKPSKEGSVKQTRAFFRLTKTRSRESENGQSDEGNLHKLKLEPCYSTFRHLATSKVEANRESDNESSGGLHEDAELVWDDLKSELSNL